MTPADLDRLEALAAAATPGPWGLEVSHSDPEGDYPVGVHGPERGQWVVRFDDDTGTNQWADGSLIAALDPPTVQQLIAAARRGMGIGVTGYWSAKSNHDITAQQWGAIREGLKTATERGLTLVVLDGIELTWHTP